MKLALLLPSLIPDLRWFMALQAADQTILDDRTPWSRKSRVHRYQIRTPQGTQWLGIPVTTTGNSLRETPMPDTSWVSAHMKTLTMNYRGSLYFDFYEAEIEAMFLKAAEQATITEAAEVTRKLLCRLLYVEKEPVSASALPEWSADPDQLASVFSADVLMMEYKSRHYQRQPVTTPTQEMPHSEYHQHFGGFYSECSILDVLFSCGPDSWKMIQPSESH